ncbi:LOW QUALITY PROTEIN: hypothetical protein CFC21_054483 [Triticum aestivum]|uniref:Late embryogenesis abundant protein LEA-2 subgroup domain-containing protein n=2 Tax=Triticum aestivum TaxID=4565 RepID=A0A3B6UAQ0_WHEAT|nr:LOW QUALITY PROTEIN: hypothetical protein CFC21_054483 [Triticum aestivum]
MTLYVVKEECDFRYLGTSGELQFAVLLVAYGFICHAEVAVVHASLTRLALATSPATAFANLSLTLTVRNKNWAMSVRNTQAEPHEADYSFDDQRFKRVRLTDEGSTRPAGKTQANHLVSDADSAYVALGNAGVEFKEENKTGVFQVEVALSGEIRYEVHTSPKCKFLAICPLKLQLTPPGTPAVLFQKVKCKLAPPDKNCL